MQAAIIVIGSADDPSDPQRADADRDYRDNLRRFTRPEDSAAEPTRDKAGEPRGHRPR